MNIEKLKKKAANLRKKTFMAFIEKGEAHLGGSFSKIESLLTIYEMILKKYHFLFVYCLKRKVLIQKLKLI